MAVWGGKVGIGTVAPSYELQVSGDIAYTGNIYDISDARWKRDVEPLHGLLDKVLALRPVSYLFRTDEYPARDFDEGLQLGLVAQEVEEVLPEVVTTDQDGYKLVSYVNLVPVLLGAVKELHRYVAATSDMLVDTSSVLLDRVDRLEEENRRMRAEMAELRAAMKALTARER